MEVKKRQTEKRVIKRTDLENFRSLIREAEEERIRLRFLESEAGRACTPEARESVRRYREDIERNLARCALLCGAVQRFINGIDDSVLRRVCTMYYINGWSWQKTAFAIGSHCEATPRNMVNRYLSRRTVRERDGLTALYAEE